MSTDPQQNGATGVNVQYNPNQQPQPQQINVDNHLLLYVFAFFVPPLAVFLQTGVCGNEFIIDLVLSFLFWFPGIIYAFFIINRAQTAGIQPKVQLMQPQPQPQPGMVQQQQQPMAPQQTV